MEADVVVSCGFTYSNDASWFSSTFDPTISESRPVMVKYSSKLAIHWSQMYDTTSIATPTAGFS